jgi:uncharacterized repeat protein (TIGR01451 family)
MKRFLLALFIVVGSLGLKAQLVADAGLDSIVCHIGLYLGSNHMADGGTPPYTYQWAPTNQISGPSNVPHPYANPVGNVTYTLTVTDNTGLTATDAVSISQFPYFIVSHVGINNVTCFGWNNGTIDLLVNTGEPPYSYIWSNGANTEDLFGLSAGAYSFTATDANGCDVISSISITQPPPLSFNLTSNAQTALTACDGSISLAVSGGTAPYTYYWSNFTNTPNITNLCSGNYSVTVTDTNSCTADTSSFIGTYCPNNTLNVSLISQDLSCTHLQDTIQAVVSGGTPPYLYVWTPQNTNASFDTMQIGEAGVVWITVYDSLGCEKTARDTLLNMSINVSLLYSHPATCNGLPDGGAKIQAFGGTPPYTYGWNNGATADSITNVAAGTYAVTVNDAVSCSIIYTLNISQNSTNWSYYTYLNTTSANCGNSGTASAAVHGGASPFTYLWSNADTSQTAKGLPSGTYNVTVTGSDGCRRMGHAVISSTTNNIIQGFVFNDANNNCVKDSGELPSLGLTVLATNGTNSYYGYTNNSGFYSLQIPSSGSFIIQVSQASSIICAGITTCSSQVVNFSGLCDSTIVNFGISGSNTYDLVLHPGWNSANPGFVKNYRILSVQKSTPLYTGSAVITFQYDSVLLFDSCNNNGIHNASTHTIEWNVDSVPYPYWVFNTAPCAYFTVPANTPIGYQLTQEFWIAPTANDCDTSDNHLSFISPVNSSKDPNTKEVFPEGNILECDSILTYTIHFQNTGNDTTWFITISDTLSPYLDPSSVANIASSQEYTSFDISGTGTLTWLFESNLFSR